MFEIVKKIFSKKAESQNLFDLLGQQKGLTHLVENFYFVMENDAEAKECLNSHQLVNGKIPDEVKKKLTYFLTGWLGGPQLFLENYGPPRMRARHMHIKINAEMGGQWLYCMDKALDKTYPKLSRNNKDDLINSFKAIALRIINSQEGA